jgi:nucleotide-binding universal stress UspA family protein
MKILLATDGTKCSDDAVKMLSNFTFTGEDSLKIISVIDMALPLSIDIYGGFLPPNVELEKAVKENADKILQETLEKIKGFMDINPAQISTEVLFGSPESRIVETAEEIKADIIIVGSHGYNSWERLLLGSVSDSVVHHAPCSVLVVRKPQN